MTEQNGAFAANPEREVSVEGGWDKRRRRIAEHIEGVALEVFASRGYRNVTVAEVAVAAGVSTRTIARYFPVKEDLLLSFVRRSVAEGITELRAAWQEGHSSKDLWDLWARLSRDNVGDVQRMTLYFRAVTQVPEILDRSRGEQNLQVRRALAELLREGYDDGPDADLHAQVVAAALQAANAAVVEHWMRSDRSGDLAESFASAASALSQELGALDRPSRRRRDAAATPRRKAQRGQGHSET